MRTGKDFNLLVIVDYWAIDRWKDIYQEQYSRTLFLRKTSKRFFVAMVSGIHPGTLMSRFFLAACCENTYSNLLARISYWVFKPLMTLFLSSMCLSSYLIWCLRLFSLFSWMFFSSSISLFLALSMPSVCDLMRALYSLSFACQRVKLSLASLLRSLSVFSRWAIFSLLAFISRSFKLIVSRS